MKPKRYKPEFAVQAWVEAESRRFRFPDMDTLATPGIPGGAGGPFTIQVAASDAHDIEKEKADIIADPTDAASAIQTAADQIHAADVNAGGRILLSSGQFTIQCDNLNIGARVLLEGASGYDTRLFNDGDTGTMLTLGTNCVVRNLTVFAQNATAANILGIDMGNGCRISGVWFNGCRCIEPANQCVIEGCGSIAGVSAFVDANSQAFQAVVIADNVEVGEIDMASGTYWNVHNNVISDGVTGNGCTNSSVIANTFLSPTPAAGASGIIELTGDRNKVAGNMVDTVSWDGIVITGDDNTVVDNTVLDFEDGIEITGDRNVVIGNTLVPDSGVSLVGINVISGNNNAVYANYLGDDADYGTADSVDSGTATQVTPAAGAIGGQFAI